MAKNDPWKDFEFKPRKDVPVQSDVAKKTRRTRRVVWFSLFIAPVLLILNFLLLGAILTQEPPEVVDSSTLSEEEVTGRALASETVINWLESQPAPLPSGRLVSWDSVDRAENLPIREGKTATGTIDVHSLTVVAESTGQLYEVQVPILMTTAGPVVSAGPSLMPYPPLADVGASMPAWPDMLPVNGVSEADLELSVSTWASALYSGNAQQLRQAVGDTTLAHYYVPMAPATVTASIDAVSATEIIEEQQPTPIVIARVNVLVNWGNLEEGQLARPVSYDVLIEGADTAAPRVVAWGGPGTGPGLEKFQNALTDIEIEIENPSAPTQVPTEQNQPTEEATDGEEN